MIVKNTMSVQLKSLLELAVEKKVSDSLLDKIKALIQTQDESQDGVVVEIPSIDSKNGTDTENGEPYLGSIAECVLYEEGLYLDGDIVRPLPTHPINDDDDEMPQLEKPKLKGMFSDSEDNDTTDGDDEEFKEEEHTPAKVQCGKCDHEFPSEYDAEKCSGSDACRERVYDFYENAAKRLTGAVMQQYLSPQYAHVVDRKKLFIKTCAIFMIPLTNREIFYYMRDPSVFYDSEGTPSTFWILEATRYMLEENNEVIPAKYRK